MNEKELIKEFSKMEKAEIVLVMILKKIEEKVEDLLERQKSVEEQLSRIALAEDKLVYSAREAAPILGIHYQTVLKWIREGKIGCIEGTNLICRGEIKRLAAHRKKRDDLSYLY